MLSSRSIPSDRGTYQPVVHDAMRPALAAEVHGFVSLGWRVKSQTATTASLETREAFNWWLFYFSLLVLFGIGGLLYVISWLACSRVHLFLHAQDDGTLTMSGDTQFLARQRQELAALRAPGEHTPPGETGGLFMFAPLLTLVVVALTTAASWFLLILGFLSLIR